MQIFVSFFVKFGDAVAYMPRVAQQRTGGVEALAGYLRNSAVEVHLTTDLVALPPRRFLIGVLEAVGCHTDIETAGVGGVEFAGKLDLVGPPMREDFVIGDFLADFPIKLRQDIVYPTCLNPQPDVGVEVIVIGDAGFGGATRGVDVRIAPHAERRDSE